MTICERIQRMQLDAQTLSGEIEAEMDFLTDQTALLDLALLNGYASAVSVIVDEMARRYPVDSHDLDYPCADCAEVVTDAEKCIKEDNCERWQKYQNQ